MTLTAQIKKIFLGALLVLALVACANPLPPDKLSYAGKWQSDEMTLLILQDGSVSYERLKNGAKVSINAPLKRFEGNDFVVGIGLLTSTFEVSEPPHEVNGKWQMVVDGVRLTRGTKANEISL